MLIGEEQDLLALGERPLQYLLRIGRGADDTAVATAKGLEVRRRVDVGHRGDLLIRFQHLGQLTPGPLYIGQIGHVRHRTASGHVGQNRGLLRARKDIRHLGHEVHTAKHDEFRIGTGRLARELERIAGKVGVTKHLFTLVVMTQDHQPLAQRLLGSNHAGLGLGIA